jgi:hypothetical protein|tara:strand:- start:210 stop:380 length:171 start_codon:yes stop_codon:yes gene_type:complete
VDTKEARQALILELVRATRGKYEIDEIMELYYFILEPDLEEQPKLSVIDINKEKNA